MKWLEFIELLIDTWIYLNEMSLYITFSLKCACIAERMAFYERESAMTCIREHQALYDYLYAMKPQYYYWYAAEFNVLAINFVVCQLVVLLNSSLLGS